MSQTSRKNKIVKNSEIDSTSRRNSILIIILTVIVIISAIAGAIVSLSRAKNDTSSSKDSSVSSTIEVEENTNELELNMYPSVNALIAKYRQAFLEGDTSLLQEVYDTDESINADILTATSQIILGYENTQYYTKRGINSGEYVVFVYDELILADISSKAPNLSVFYVMTNSEGTLYIYRGDYNAASGSYVYSDDVQSYINTLYEDEDVLELISTVNTKLDSACANDEDLMNFMEKVRNKTSSSSTSTSTTEETEESESDESSDAA